MDASWTRRGRASPLADGAGKQLAPVPVELCEPALQLLFERLQGPRHEAALGPPRRWARPRAAGRASSADGAAAEAEVAKRME